MRKIYFTDWLKNRHIDVDIFLKQLKYSKAIKTLSRIHKIMSDRSAYEYIDVLMYWDGTSWPYEYTDDNYLYWAKLNSAWNKFYENQKRLGHEIKFCRPGEISEDLKYADIKIVKKKSKKIKKLKI